MCHRGIWLATEIIFVAVEDLLVCVSQRNLRLSRIWTRLIMLMALFWFSRNSRRSAEFCESRSACWKSAWVWKLFVIYIIAVTIRLCLASLKPTSFGKHFTCLQISNLCFWLSIVSRIMHFFIFSLTFRTSCLNLMPLPNFYLFSE